MVYVQPQATAFPACFILRGLFGGALTPVLLRLIVRPLSSNSKRTHRELFHQLNTGICLDQKGHPGVQAKIQNFTGVWKGHLCTRRSIPVHNTKGLYNLKVAVLGGAGKPSLPLTLYCVLKHYSTTYAPTVAYQQTTLRRQSFQNPHLPLVSIGVEYHMLLTVLLYSSVRANGESVRCNKSACHEVHSTWCSTLHNDDDDDDTGYTLLLLYTDDAVAVVRTSICGGYTDCIENSIVQIVISESPTILLEFSIDPIKAYSRCYDMDCRTFLYRCCVKVETK